MKSDLDEKQDLIRNPRKQSAHWPLFFAILAVLIALPIIWWFVLSPTPHTQSSRPGTFVVREGEGWQETTTHLQDQGYVKQPLTFEAIVMLDGARGKLLPGRYELRRGMSARDIISTLTNESAAASITIPEGWRTEQIESRMIAEGLTTRAQWEQALSNPPDNPVLTSKPSGVPLQGYIFPDTYRFTEKNAARQLVYDSLATLNSKLTPTIRTGFAKQGLTVHQGLTLASIVEREAQVPWERPIIASVYLNRLHRGMKLQADPTTQYAVGKPGNWWPSHLTYGDLANPSPYNTYVHKGLPPGPICNPGLPSIEAVAKPAHTQYLYFVAKGDGTHVFAKTYAEHERNVQQYQSGR